MFVLRRKRPDLERPYRVVGYPVVPALFLLASLGMVVNALVTDPVNTGVTLGIIAAARRSTTCGAASFNILSLANLAGTTIPRTLAWITAFRRPVLLAVSTLVCSVTFSAAAAPPTQLFGFSADETAAQRSIEQRF